MKTLKRSFFVSRVIKTFVGFLRHQKMVDDLRGAVCVESTSVSLGELFTNCGIIGRGKNIPVKNKNSELWSTDRSWGRSPDQDEVDVRAPCFPWNITGPYRRQEDRKIADTLHGWVDKWQAEWATVYWTIGDLSGVPGMLSSWCCRPSLKFVEM